MDDAVRKLHSTTDAQVWAQEWCRIAREVLDRGDEVIDEGWMIGWFANAIEVGRAAGLASLVGSPWRQAVGPHDPRGVAWAEEVLERIEASPADG